MFLSKDCSISLSGRSGEGGAGSELHNQKHRLRHTEVPRGKSAETAPDPVEKYKLTHGPQTRQVHTESTGSLIPRLFQSERPSSRGESVSRSVVSDSLWPHGLQPARLLHPWDPPGKNTGVGCYALLQGIFPTQGLNPGLLHCRQVLYHLSHQRSPPSSRGTSGLLRPGGRRQASEGEVGISGL